MRLLVTLGKGPHSFSLNASVQREPSYMRAETLESCTHKSGGPALISNELSSLRLEANLYWTAVYDFDHHYAWPVGIIFNSKENELFNIVSIFQRLIVVSLGLPVHSSAHRPSVSCFTQGTLWKA